MTHDLLNRIRQQIVEALDSLDQIEPYPEKDGDRYSLEKGVSAVANLDRALSDVRGDDRKNFQRWLTLALVAEAVSVDLLRRRR